MEIALGVLGSVFALIYGLYKFQSSITDKQVALENRITRLESDKNNLEKRIDDLDKKMNSIDTKLDKFFETLNNQSNQITRLVTLAEKNQSTTQQVNVGNGVNSN